MDEASIRKQIEVLNELVAVSAEIRQKYKRVRAGRDASEEVRNEMFKPIVKPLQELVHTSKQQLKQEAELEPLDLSTKNEEEYKPLYSSAGNGGSDEEHWASADDADDVYGEVDSMDVDGDHEDEDEDEGEDDTLVAGDTSSTGTPMRKEENLVWQYLKKFDTEEQKDLDSIYGVRKLLRGTMIGDSRIKFVANRIYVGDKHYKTAPGLLELLFEKSPDITLLTDEDRKNYAKIVMETNVLRKHYKPDGMPRDNENSAKYRYFIARYVDPRWGRSKSGGGLPNYKIARAEGQRIKYVRWSDPNTLVDRLRVLVQSQAAGDINVSNEIVSIIEELREAEIIH